MAADGAPTRLSDVEIADVTESTRAMDIYYRDLVRLVEQYCGDGGMIPWPLRLQLSSTVTAAHYAGFLDGVMRVQSMILGER